ncbi:MAG: hypothetical protein M1822_008014 [Bathelium mastoideum]|nr:MAG: hypothetical protein M1822_008014 [Bathelium mastoideum]
MTSWVYCMVEDDVEHFSERSNERNQFFEETANHLPVTQLSPLLWAFFQVGDLEALKDIAHSKVSWDNVYCEEDVALSERRALDAIRLWKQHSAGKDTTASNKRSYSEAMHRPTQSSPLQSLPINPSDLPRTRSGKSSQSPEYSPVRDRKIAELSKERDHGLCVVSRISGVNACHLYPWCAFGGKDPNRIRRFWAILRTFWSEDKVSSWHAKIFQDDRTPRGTGTVENMYTLTSTLRRFHSEGAFALRPVRMSNDKTQLELEFHWLARQQRDSTVRVDLREQPLSSRNRTDSEFGITFCRFENSAKPTPLISGTRFTMTTNYPINKPFPDPGLLEMQWHLQRILAMSGAAGWKEEDFDYDDPDAAVDTFPSVEHFVEHWLDDLPAAHDQSHSSPGELEDIVTGAHKHATWILAEGH